MSEQGAAKRLPLREEAGGRGAKLYPLLAAVLLTWPAFLNGYPLVFSDSGTYLSQALNHYLGWDRPIFYSFFMLPLHMGLTTWPVVAAQALMTAWVLQIALRALLPESSTWVLVAFVAVLALASPLPWFVAQLMPDFLTGLLILALSLLVLVPDRLGRLEAAGLAALSTFASAAHLANLLLALGLSTVLLPLRRRLGARSALDGVGLARIAGAPVGTALALLAINLAGHGALAIAPYGNVFLLARVMEDGPGCTGAGLPGRPLAALCRARQLAGNG